MLRRGTAHQQVAARGSGQSDETSYFDVVRSDGMLSAAETVHPLDGEHIRSDPLDSRADAVEELRKFLDVRFGSRVADDRLSRNEHGGHQRVLCGSHAGLIEEYVLPL